MAPFWQAAMLLVAVLMAGHATAQSLADMISEVPTCALSCVTTPLLTGNCLSSNLTLLEECTCTNVPLMSNMSTCVQISCDFADQVTAGNILMGLCVDFPKESRVYELRASAIATITITAVVVAARCAARLHLTGRLWSDDWTALAAGVMLVVGGALELASSQIGFGLHFWDVYVSKATSLLQMFYVVEILYTWIKLVAKISIILLYMRVFTGRHFRWACYICLGYCAISLTTFTFVIVFQCRPIESIWNRYIQGQCLSVNATGYVGAVLSVVEDIVLMLLPIPELRKLQISGRKRIGVALMFILASFAAVTSMVRLKYLVQFSKTYDTSYDNVDIIVWSLIELTCIVVCGSLPPLRPYLAKLLPALSTINSSKRKGKSSGNGSDEPSAKATELSNMTNSINRRSRRLGSTGGFTELKEPKEIEEAVEPERSKVPSVDERSHTALSRWYDDESAGDLNTGLAYPHTISRNERRN